jgi:hypothetical protein
MIMDGKAPKPRMLSSKIKTICERGRQSSGREEGVEKQIMLTNPF